MPYTTTLTASDDPNYPIRYILTSPRGGIIINTDVPPTTDICTPGLMAGSRITQITVID
jgi:hypothetical protein